MDTLSPCTDHFGSLTASYPSPPKSDAPTTVNSSISLMQAVGSLHDPSLTHLLLSRGANVHAVNDKGFSAILFIDKKFEHALLIQSMLLQYGGDLQLSRRAYEWAKNHPPESFNAALISPRHVYKWVYNYMSKHTEMPEEWDFPLLADFLQLCIQIHSTNKAQLFIKLR